MPNAQCPMPNAQCPMPTPTPYQVQQWGCGALSALADGDQACHSAVCNAVRHTGRSGSGSSAAAASGAGGGGHAILQAMAMHPAHVQVAQLGCAALAMLLNPGLAGVGGASVAQCAAAAREVVAYGGAALTVRAMGRHKQLPVQLQGCAMLALLAELNEGVNGAAAARAAAAVHLAAGVASGHGKVCRRPSGALATLQPRSYPHPEPEPRRYL